jgi:hypothetical protein
MLRAAHVRTIRTIHSFTGYDVKAPEDAPGRVGGRNGSYRTLLYW